MTPNLPPEIIKTRDELAKTEVEQFTKRLLRESHGPVTSIYNEAYRDGFDAAAKLFMEREASLMKEAEKLATSLSRLEEAADNYLSQYPKETWWENKYMSALERRSTKSNDVLIGWQSYKSKLTEGKEK